MRWLLRHRGDAAYVLLGLLVAVVVLAGGSQGNGRGVASAVLGGAALAIFVWRRSHPLLVSIVALLALCAALGLQSDVPAILFFATMVAFALAGFVNVTRDAVIAWAVGAVTLGFAAWRSAPALWWSDFLLTLAFVTLMWAAGHLVARRTLQAWRMGERARDAELAGAAALLEQRAEIARELHDVVSHGLAVVVLQTVAARATLSDMGAEGDAVGSARGRVLERHLDAVEGTAREALDEMRRMLGLLRTHDWDDTKDASHATADIEPRPGLDQIPTLIDRARSAGLVVEDRVDHELEVSSGLGLAAYRVVQEGLTNVAKHAGGASVIVAVTSRGDALDVRVQNEGGGPGGVDVAGSGMGLRGLAERVELYGGTLAAAPTTHGF